MDKLDFIKQDKNLYNPPTVPEIIKVPAMHYIMYDGKGTPEDNPAFQEAFSALYAIAYTIKFMPKKGLTPDGYRDFKVPPPEGLWWMDDGKDFDQARAADWRWTLMIRMPDFVTRQLVDEAAKELAAKKKSDVYFRVRFGEVNEGTAVQIMHIGPYDAEGPDLAAMDNFARTKGYHYTGKHHEIYFGDPRRTKPEKLRTVLRHPVLRLTHATQTELG